MFILKIIATIFLVIFAIIFSCVAADEKINDGICPLYWFMAIVEIVSAILMWQ